MTLAALADPKHILFSVLLPALWGLGTDSKRSADHGGEHDEASDHVWHVPDVKDGSNGNALHAA